MTNLKIPFEITWVPTMYVSDIQTYATSFSGLYSLFHNNSFSYHVDTN